MSRARTKNSNKVGMLDKMYTGIINPFQNYKKDELIDELVNRGIINILI